MEQRIVEKAHELFFRYGIKSVTMDDMATKLGMSKKTLYQYFADKHSLVEAVVRKEIAADEEECRCNQKISENAVHETFLVLDMLQEMLENMHPGIIFEMEKYHPTAFDIFKQHKNQFIYKMIRENIKRGMAEGLYREGLDADVLAKFRIESIFIPFNPETFPPHKYNLVHTETLLMEHFLYGICNTKGQKQIEKYFKQRAKTKQNA